MPTAILDLDIQQLPQEVCGLQSYTSALILIRLGQRPIGQIWLPLQQGRITGSELRARLFDTVGWPLGQAWVDKHLGRQEPATANPCSTSIAVCTRNRPDDLRRCLESLMRLPDDGQEILVVDNAPDDEQTREVVGMFPQVRYIHEERPGLSNARNRAMREASGDIIAFTDDDAVVDAGWLRAAQPHFDDRLVACVTGLTMPLELQTAAQEAFEICFSFGRGFIRRAFDISTHNPLMSHTIGAGVNMFIRRAARNTVGPMSDVFGPPMPTCADDDNNWLSSTIMKGYRIVYEPEALVWHRHRRTEAELLQVARCYGIGIGARLTHHLLVHRQIGAVELWWRALFEYGIPRWMTARFHQHNPLIAATMAAWLHGFLQGPQSYFAARQQLRFQGGEL